MRHSRLPAFSTVLEMGLRVKTKALKTTSVPKFLFLLEVLSNIGTASLAVADALEATKILLNVGDISLFVVSKNFSKFTSVQPQSLRPQGQPSPHDRAFRGNQAPAAHWQLSLRAKVVGPLGINYLSREARWCGRMMVTRYQEDTVIIFRHLNISEFFPHHGYPQRLPSSDRPLFTIFCGRGLST